MHRAGEQLQGVLSATGPFGTAAVRSLGQDSIRSAGSEDVMVGSGIYDQLVGETGRGFSQAVHPV